MQIFRPDSFIPFILLVAFFFLCNCTMDNVSDEEKCVIRSSFQKSRCLKNNSNEELLTHAFYEVLVQAYKDSPEKITCTIEDAQLRLLFAEKYGQRVRVEDFEKLTKKRDGSRTAKDGKAVFVMYADEAEIERGDSKIKLWVNGYTNMWDFVIYEVVFKKINQKWKVSEVKLVGMS